MFNSFRQQNPKRTIFLIFSILIFSPTFAAPSFNAHSLDCEKATSPMTDRCQDAFTALTPLQQAIAKNDPPLFLKNSDSPILVRAPQLDGEEEVVALSPQEFKKYFSIIFQPLLQANHNWQVGYAQLGAGSAYAIPLMVWGYPSKQPQLYLLINGTTMQLQIPSMPTVLKQLKRDKEKLFVNNKNIAGTYVAPGGILRVRKEASKSFSVSLALAQGNLGFFNGVSVDSATQTLRFVNQGSDAKCALAIKFSPAVATITYYSPAMECSFGQGVSALGNYQRYGDRNPSAKEMKDLQNN